MKKTFAYTYTVLRYVHDTTTGEFVNVGIALYAPQAKYVSAICRHTYGRLSRTFPGVNGEQFRQIMQYIQGRFQEHHVRLSQQLPLEEAPETVMDVVRAVLPPDDSSLQWSAIGSGSTGDPTQTLDDLFDRMVMRYDQKPQGERRSDEEVWRGFKRTLEERKLLQHFQPKTIAVEDDEVEFQHAWKNGVWHCLEPLSFDLSASDSIRDKAHKWLGQIASVQKAEERFKVYLLLGKPQNQDAELLSAFYKAVSILRKVPVDNEIFVEDNAHQLGERFAAEFKAHIA